MDYWQQRFAIPRFDGHTVVTQAIATDLLAGHRVLRLEGGVDDEPDLYRALSRDYSTVTVAGRLDHLNGIDLVLDAFRLLSRSDLRLKIAGAGPLEEHVQEAVRHDSRIEYLGFLESSDVRRLYAQSDLLLAIRRTLALDSRYFFPSKVLEYFATGIPTLATAMPDLVAEFADKCFILTSETPKALAQSITEVLGLPPAQRRAVASRARAYVRANKSWPAQLERLRGYVGELMEDAPGR